MVIPPPPPGVVSGGPNSDPSDPTALEANLLASWLRPSAISTILARSRPTKSRSTGTRPWPGLPPTWMSSEIDYDVIMPGSRHEPPSRCHFANIMITPPPSKNPLKHLHIADVRGAAQLAAHSHHRCHRDRGGGTPGGVGYDADSRRQNTGTHTWHHRTSVQRRLRCHRPGGSTRRSY